VGGDAHRRRHPYPLPDLRPARDAAAQQVREEIEKYTENVTMPNHKARRLLFLFSDTGGGHRSSAHAVAQALRDMYGERVQIDLVDFLAHYAPWPLNRLGDIYPHLVRMRGWPWAIGYHLSNGQLRVKLLTQCCWPMVRESLLRILRERPADVIISCHPILNHWFQHTLTKIENETSLITLVTDLNTAHAFWFAPGVSHCIAPTVGAGQCAVASGLPAECISVTGLPVSSHFITAAQEDPLDVRRGLGLDPSLPVALLVGGAEGMGPLRRLSQMIADTGLPAQLALVTGRNERLRKRLTAEEWPLPVRVEGFVSNMHEWMRAADLLVSKASPSTVSEALVVGLPIVLSGALPGQERPTVDYIVQAGAGIWAPTAKQVATTVRDLLTSDHRKREQMAACAHSLAQPEAARRVAEIVWTAANKKPTL